MTRTRLAVLVLTAFVAGILVDRILAHRSSSATGSGVAATQARAVAPFSRITLEGDNNVVVRVGPTRSVVVHADHNLLGRVTTTVRAGGLVIGTTPGSFSARSPMFVEVRLPALDAITLQGAGNIAVTGVRSRRLTVTLPGSGNITADGTATTLGITLGGEGTIRLHQLVARDANAELGGSGTIMLTATHSLAATVSGSGTVLYGGGPAHVTPRVTGSGTIIAG